MARHRATRPSIASVISTTSTNGTRTRTKLSYEQNALLALAENSLKKNKKPLNVSAIVKAAERRAHEQGLELGVRARPGIKKAVEKLTERGAIAEAPRKGRSPAEYRLTPKAVKIFNDAKSHRRSDIGIAKETIEVLKGDAERPSKRRRSSVSTTVASPTRSAQQVTIAKLKAELAAARSEIESLKKSNNDLLDQQLDDGDDDIFDSPVRNANARKDTDLATRSLLAPPHNVSFLGSRPTRPTTPEPTENGSPEYDAPGEFDFTMAIPREMTPSFSLDAGGTRGTQEEQIVPEKSELELKIERLEAAMSELVLEKTQMAEEIVALKNQVEHERQSVTHLMQVQHEADLVRVELAQVSKDRDSAVKDVSFLTQDNAALERRCVEVVTAKQQLELTISQLNADIEARITAEAEVRASLADTTQELGATKQLLALAQDETLRLSETLDMEYGTTALLTSNLSARESTIADLQATASLTENQLQTLRGEATALRESLASAEERALRTELVVQERDAQILGLKAEEEALRSTIEGLQGQNNDLLCERAERISQLDAMKAKAERDLTNIQDLDKAIEGLNAQVDALRDDLDGALAHSDQLRAKAEEDSAAAGRLIAERDITIAERDVHLAKLGRNLHNQVQQLGESQARVNQLEAALAASTRTAESLKSSRETLEGELASAADTIVELSNKIDSLEANDQANAKYIAELKLDLDRHKRSIEEHQDLISKLELQLQRLRDIELGRLRKRQARIKAEAERLREEEDELTRETIDVDQWDEGLTQSRAARSSLAPSWTAPSSP